MVKSKFPFWFLILGIFITLIFCFIFTPVSDSGDSHAYIQYALKILGNDISDNFMHRSPLYSVLLAGFIKIFGTSIFPTAVLVFQFIIVFITAILLYSILTTLTRNKKTAIAGSSLFLLSFSTVFYGYHLLSESLTVFLFVLSVYLLFRYLNNNRRLNLIFAGLIVSLMILTRFNTLPLVFAYIFLIILIDFSLSGFKFLRCLINLSLFLLIPFIIYNGLASFNLKRNGFYGLFPYSGSGITSRNAILATLNGNEIVNPENRFIHEIFIKAKKINDKDANFEKKGSLLNLDRAGIIPKLYAGYNIYGYAYYDLCNYLNINPESAEQELSLRLSGYYGEILRQNRTKVLIMKFYSFLNSFRSSSGITSPGNGTNLNRLPSQIVILYKVLFLSLSVSTFLLTICYLVLFLLGRIKLDIPGMVIIILCYSFYAINFIFGTVGDANRFKFPSDPLIFGLFVFYLSLIIRWIKSQNLNFEHTFFK